LPRSCSARAMLCMELNGAPYLLVPNALIHLYHDPHEQNVRFTLHYDDMTDAASLEIKVKADVTRTSLTFDEPFQSPASRAALLSASPIPKPDFARIVVVASGGPSTVRAVITEEDRNKRNCSSNVLHDGPSFSKTDLAATSGLHEMLLRFRGIDRDQFPARNIATFLLANPARRTLTRRRHARFTRR
jgi:hypothetical protein